jgi:RimJ/RimL family protein N-acetyltransferase
MKELRTKRLRITPMTDNELRAAIASETDEHMKQAYSEMLAGCLAHPRERIWYTEWRITRRETGEPVGGLGFKGPQVNGAVEIGYGIFDPRRGNGYATEAAKAMIGWAFSQEGVYFVTAETEPDNAASQRVLEKLGFSPAGAGEEGPRFEKERPASAWFSIYLCLGLSIGLCLGTSFDNIAIGMSLGMCIGLALGSSLDAADKKKRAALRAARTETRN